MEDWVVVKAGSKGRVKLSLFTQHGNTMGEALPEEECTSSGLFFCPFLFFLTALVILDQLVLSTAVAENSLHHGKTSICGTCGGTRGQGVF